MDAVLAAVDLADVVTTLTPILVIAVGIALAFKGVILGKRAIAKA